MLFYVEAGVDVCLICKISAIVVTMEGTSCLCALRPAFCLHLFVLYHSDETLLIRRDGRNDRHASFGACQRCGGKLL